MTSFRKGNLTLIVSDWVEYEIYLYDRAGHGFSSHIPKGLEYSNAHNLQDLRTVVQSESHYLT